MSYISNQLLTRTGSELSLSSPPVAKRLLQRKCDCGQHTIAGGECDECGKQHLSLQRATRNSELETLNSAAVPPIVHDVLRSSGQPLDTATRAFFEPRFGHDFSRVRVHTDAESARVVNALAYTVGRHVAFGPGQYKVDTSAGKRLLAHELTHVVQQGHVGNSSVQAKLNIGPSEDGLEREAERLAEQVMDANELTNLAPVRASLQGAAEVGVQRAVPGALADQTAIDGEPAGEPEIACTATGIGEYTASCMAKTNEQPYTRCLGLSDDLGIHYPGNYKRECEQAGHKERWNADYYKGYADPLYFERDTPMAWRLKPGVSASVGLKKWLKGFTIAECNSTVVACEYDSLRAGVGDAKFDETFGSVEKDIPVRQRMYVKQGTRGTPLDGFMVPTGARLMDEEEGTFGNRPAVIGEWYYFYNHPKYLLKHPGSDWQGENSVYAGRNEAGEQLWTGLGANKRTEQQLLAEMVIAYNFNPSSHDEEVRERIRIRKGGSLPDIYRPKSETTDGYPDQVDMFDIIADPAYTIVDPFDGEPTTRKGGFDVGAGKKLAEQRAQELRDR